MSYDRYKLFKGDGEVKTLPFLNIGSRNSDYFEIFDGKKRLDQISHEYYGDSNYDWLIMAANPQYGSMEFEINKGVILRIPYPLNSALESYENAVKNYNILYGYN